MRIKTVSVGVKAAPWFEWFKTIICATILVLAALSLPKPLSLGGTVFLFVFALLLVGSVVSLYREMTCRAQTVQGEIVRIDNCMADLKTKSGELKSLGLAEVETTGLRRGIHIEALVSGSGKLLSFTTPDQPEKTNND
ncbi:MAG: hypothetical protein AAF434_05260 [Pseudomonadota bacterium]